VDANRVSAAWIVPTDPVCGRNIEPVPIAYHGHYADTTYYFCSVQCRDKFQANPGTYLRPDVPAPVVTLRVQDEPRPRLA